MTDRIASIAAEKLLEEFGIEIVPANAAPRPGQTRAPKTVARIIRRYGEEHARLVLTTIAETANNGLVMDEAGLWAVSDLIRACPGLVERQMGDFLELFDAMPLGDLHQACKGLYGVVPVRFALVGMAWERIIRRFGTDQLDLLDDRRGQHERRD